MKTLTIIAYTTYITYLTLCITLLPITLPIALLHEKIKTFKKNQKQSRR